MLKNGVLSTRQGGVCFRSSDDAEQGGRHSYDDAEHNGPGVVAVLFFHGLSFLIKNGL
jgi:hypothetical protein